MELIEQTHDLTILYVTASSFPDGIMDAFRALERKLSETGDRIFYGLSKPNNKGVIVYKAGALQTKEDEAKRLELESIVVPKGLYLSQEVKNWKKKPEMIGNVFQKMIHDPRLDPSTYCVERYEGEDVVCMVRILHK